MDLQITCIIFRGQAIIFSGRDFQYPEGVPGDSDDWRWSKGICSIWPLIVSLLYYQMMTLPSDFYIRLTI